MIRCDDASTVVLALTVKIASTDELFVKQHHNLVISVTDHSAAQTERNILPLNRVNVDDSVTNLEIVCGALVERSAPVREPLCENLVRFEKLKTFYF